MHLRIWVGDSVVLLSQSTVNLQACHTHGRRFPKLLGTLTDEGREFWSGIRMEEECTVDRLARCRLALIQLNSCGPALHDD